MRKGMIAGAEKINVNLARLTEEYDMRWWNRRIESITDLLARIIETVVSGHKYLQLSKRGSFGDSAPSRRSSADKHNAESVKPSSSVSVTLNIAHRQNWNITIAPGAWTRILTNLVGKSSISRTSSES